LGDQLRVDGFRFDLGLTLGREADGFDPAAFFDVLRQDPVLGRLKLLTEPWDVGPGGYQLGNFPPGFSEWNDKYRDTVRKFWRATPASAVIWPRDCRIGGPVRPAGSLGQPQHAGGA
jgi:pullulanase/glycogen debranching enzyme